MNIIEAFNEYGINATIGETFAGPTVTRYEVELPKGTILSRVRRLEDSLAMTLGVQQLRLFGPTGKRRQIILEVPNEKPSLVSLSDMLRSSEWAAFNGTLPLFLGKDVFNAANIVDLEKMPHLLVAGATGSGKTVCINSIIVGLLNSSMAKKNLLHFVMVDPKRVELQNYNQLKQLIHPVVTDCHATPKLLDWLIECMELRYNMFNKIGARNIKEYNQKENEKMGYMVVIIDEIADLMLTVGKEIESKIARLAQLARAAGIHLILATQRPSSNIITGIIKANFIARIAFRVASRVDSRVILDSSGAENLVGQGDMLLSTPEQMDLIRLQGMFVSNKEIERAIESNSRG